MEGHAMSQTDEKVMRVTIGRGRACPCGRSDCWLYRGQTVTLRESTIDPSDIVRGEVEAQA